MSLWSACMRVSRGPGSQRSQSSLCCTSSTRSVPFCSSHTVTHTHAHIWLCSHGASVSVIAACHPYLSSCLSLSPSLCCCLSLLLRDGLFFLPCFLFSPSNKGPQHHTRFLTLSLIFERYRLLHYPLSPWINRLLDPHEKKKKTRVKHLHLRIDKFKGSRVQSQDSTLSGDNIWRFESSFFLGWSDEFDKLYRMCCVSTCSPDSNTHFQRSQVSLPSLKTQLPRPTTPNCSAVLFPSSPANTSLPISLRLLLLWVFSSPSDLRRSHWVWAFPLRGNGPAFV